MTRYVCRICGLVEAAPLIRCCACNTIGSFAEKTVSNVPHSNGIVVSSPTILIDHKRKRPTEPARPTPITKLSHGRLDRVAFPSGFDEVLGGGAVRGSSVIVTGEPGIGKSTLLLQALGFLAKHGEKPLYVSGEESSYQVADRARRVGASVESLKIVSAKFLAPIVSAIENSRCRVALIDSVNVIVPSEHDRPGGVIEIKQCASVLAEVAAKRGIVLLFVAHVTKDGELSGPKAFEHLVDVVLTFEGRKREKKRTLAQEKNRYGATDVSAIYEMADIGLLLKEVENGCSQDGKEANRSNGRRNQKGSRLLVEKAARGRLTRGQEKGKEVA